MKELVTFLASSLVDDPTAVAVSEKASDGSVLFSLRVRKEDLGKVIGKKGRTAKAMRAFLQAAGRRQKLRVSLEIIEPEPLETENAD